MGEKTDQTDKAPLNPELKARNDAIYGRGGRQRRALAGPPGPLGVA